MFQKYCTISSKLLLLSGQYAMMTEEAQLFCPGMFEAVNPLLTTTSQIYALLQIIFADFYKSPVTDLLAVHSNNERSGYIVFTSLSVAKDGNSLREMQVFSILSTLFCFLFIKLENINGSVFCTITV